MRFFFTGRSHIHTVIQGFFDDTIQKIIFHFQQKDRRGIFRIMVILSFFPLLFITLFIIFITYHFTIIIIFIILLFFLDIITSTHPVTTVARLVTSCHIAFYYATISRCNSSYVYVISIPIYTCLLCLRQIGQICSYLRQPRFKIHQV